MLCREPGVGAAEGLLNGVQCRHDLVVPPGLAMDRRFRHRSRKFEERRKERVPSDGDIGVQCASDAVEEPGREGFRQLQRRLREP
ncbi:hypothetical protein GCM10029992_38270 [Glycomyces albus]